MTAMYRLSGDPNQQEPTENESICMPLSKGSPEEIPRTVSLERNEFSVSECLDANANHEKSMHNGNFYEGTCTKHHPNYNNDPWIPRPKGSKSKYFCVKNESSLDSSPKNELNFCSKCNLVYESSFAVAPLKRQEKSKTRSAKILFHFRKFCETTSLRGVPRIVHSKTKRFRLLWMIFVLVFFIACMTCLILLIKQYRAYDVIHQPKTSYNDPSNFPSVTFCNLRPFSSRTIDFLKRSNAKSLADFLYSLRKAVDKTSVTSVNLTKEDQQLFSSAISLELFLMNLPTSVNMESIGHSKNSMIIYCSFQYANGSEFFSTPCEQAGKFILTKNELFLNCYTYTVFEKYLKSAKAVDLILHVDERLQFECADCNPFVTASQMTGIRFSLHSAGTYPDVIIEGQNLSPGTFTDAVFYTKQWNMMEPPHGKCSKELTPQYDFVEGEFLYSLSGCKKYFIQKLLYENCGCIKYSSIPKYFSHLNKSKDVCNFIDHSIFKNSTETSFDLETVKLFLNRTKCKKEISYQFLDDYKTCTVSCQHYTFDVKVSSGIYPTKSFHLSFTKKVQRILKKKISFSDLKLDDRKELEAILNKLKVYDQISNMIKNGSVEEAERLLKNTDVIEKNFLTIQINRQDFNIIKVEEKEVISITSFLSQTGGMFSIWSGITFFCLVEFIELMMNIFDTITSFKT